MASVMCPDRMPIVLNLSKMNGLQNNLWKNVEPITMLLKVIDSFGTTGIFQFPYFMDNKVHSDALYVKPSRDTDRLG